MRKLGSVVAMFMAPLVVQAEVTASAPDGFVSEHVVLLEAAPDDAYRALTENLAAWWDAAHSYSGDASNFSLDDRAGGCFCESLPGGGSVEHLRVVFASPGRLLRMQGGLGPLQAMAVQGTMEFRLEGVTDEQTRLEYRYAVSGYAPGGLQSLADPVDQVQGGQLARLAAYVAGKQR